MYPKSTSLSARPAIDLAFYEQLNQLKKTRDPLTKVVSMPDAPRPRLVPEFFKDGSLPCLRSVTQTLVSSEPKLTGSPTIIKSSSGTVRGERARPSPATTPGSTPTQSPSPSPRRSSPSNASVTSVSPATSSANSSANASPATTPRGEGGKEKTSGARKLQRKLTQKAEDIAAAVLEVLKGQGGRSRAGSGELGSPKKPESPRVRFGSIDPVDLGVDLDDPRFDTFVRDAADAAFSKPWKNDTSDVTDVNGNRKKNADKLQPTFIRDFDNSLYYCLDNEGERVRLDTTDAFIDYIGTGQCEHFAKVVSNIASQNLGNFLKNVLFLRQDAQKKSHSILRLNDGTPIMPLAIARASYTFARDARGKLTIDYCWESSAKLNAGNPLRMKTLDDASRTLQVSDEAKLRINVRVTVDPDGQWEIANPRVQASGWNVIESL